MRKHRLIQTDDKRADVRIATDIPIALSLFQTKSDFIGFETRTRNQSSSGICFSAGREFYPETVVFIRALDADRPADQQASLPRNTTLGEVRWCRQIKGQKGEQYLVGVRYC